MERDDIIRMAQKAGVLSGCESDLFVRFAALVAAAEREACALECEKHFEYYGYDHVFAAAIRARGEK